MSSSSSSSSSCPTKHCPSFLDDSTSTKLPLREIPGHYGLPFLGPIKDRLDYYYNQGQDEFLRTRMQIYKSTIFRTNMPPGPFMSPNPKVVAVLDAINFPVLFDTSKVEKKNVLDGTYMPSTAFTGGYRVCAYLDPSEPKHTTLKAFFLSLLASRHHKFIPTFRTVMSELFTTLEVQISDNGSADFNSLSDKLSFDFVLNLLFDSNSNLISATNIRANGSKLVTKWLFFQLAPLMTLGLKYLPNCVEDLLLHTFPLPSFLVNSDYRKLYDAFYASASSVLDDAESCGINHDEACHNLVFLAGFNAFGGMKVLFPALIKWVGSAGEGLHRRLADEIRAVVKSEGGVTLLALDKMSLTKSVVYEALKIEPPIPFQYGNAKEDMMVHSHDAAFVIKKDEMIFGYQPFATKDPRVFETSEEFVGDRFVGDGERLLKYVYWSNGRESDNPTAENKQCLGKDLVLLMSRVMLTEFFLWYDTFTVEIGKLLSGPSVKIKSLTKASDDHD